MTAHTEAMLYYATVLLMRLEFQRARVGAADKGRTRGKSWLKSSDYVFKTLA